MVLSNLGQLLLTSTKQQTKDHYSCELSRSSYKIIYYK